METSEIIEMVNTEKMDNAQRNCLYRELELSILSRNLEMGINIQNDPNKKKLANLPARQRREMLLEYKLDQMQFV